MADRNRELVPDNWSLVRERALQICDGRYNIQLCLLLELQYNCISLSLCARSVVSIETASL